MCKSLERNEFSCESSSQTISESQNEYEFLDVVSSLELEVKTEKIFSTWEACEKFLNEWAKEQGRSYDSTSNKDTNTKKTQCSFLVNTSCPKVNNPKSTIVINKIVYEHNHPLNLILTDADPAINTAIHQVFTNIYPIYCAYHITQNLHKNLRKLLDETYQKFLDNFYLCHNCLSKEGFQQRFEQLVNNHTKAQHYLEFLYKSKNYWVHCFTNFKFTGSMIATLRVESVNTCLKRLIYNSNTSLCELATEIYKLLDIQDKENEYKFWKLAIPMVKHQEKVNFLFSKVDQCIQQFLTPTMLKIQRDEINQSVYYVANKVAHEDMESLDDNDLQFSSRKYSADDLQAMLKQMIEFVGLDDIEELWTINVSNSLKSKHYVILLQNGSHLCFCLSIIHHGIVCRHYFQVMLVTSKTKFHIHLLSLRWFCTSENGMEEPFLVADKFYQETQN
ncbi:8786_t:CDS:2 [Cetraspora pellucida]|uniref:8786_t:CDS:1 n=1 Tax=Cetraspora pellucida TaxID=1433469 RepID=A0ACA9KP73_9GLOM|nr:8786_t:CDS:2 [Cetraspora pellucida]